MIRKPSAGDVAKLAWFKSSYSSSSNGEDCVEIATAPDLVHVRDSKNVEGPRLGFSPQVWRDFIAYAHARG
ncbi:DUF397 domain-containing protein [Streptomyces sp. NPDC048696]|uniref:DUF397 domain-containing protein n=1 Tax=Streptomyces sp. NPDC048696 TaxID=3365585 RepID=UPI00371859FB